MGVPVLVEQQGGAFVAVVLGHPSVRAEGATRDQAVEGLQDELRERTRRGELVWISQPEVPSFFPVREVSAEERRLVDEMVAEIYRERDAQKAAEFPE